MLSLVNLEGRMTKMDQKPRRRPEYLSQDVKRCGPRTFGTALILLTFCTIFSCPNAADAQAVACESINDSARRLECFDRKTRVQERLFKHEEACALLTAFAGATGDIRKNANFSANVQLCNTHPDKDTCLDTAEFLSTRNHVPKNILACRGGR